MTFEQATKDLPVNGRECLLTSLLKHGIHPDSGDPVMAAALIHAELTVALDKRRNVLLGIMAVASVFGMSLTGLAGYWYGRTKTPTSIPVAVSLPKASTLDGKDVLIVDAKTWDLQAWIHADRAYVFPKTATKNVTN